MDKELDSFSSKGSTDAKLNKDVSVDLGKIKPAARNIYYHIKAQYSGAAEKAKMQFSHCEEKIKNLKKSIQTKQEKLEDVEVMSFLKLVCYYTLPGLRYGIGDIMFVKIDFLPAQIPIKSFQYSDI